MALSVYDLHNYFSEYKDKIAHLDIKLDNFFMEDDYNLYLGDFDLSHAMEDLENYSELKNILILLFENQKILI